MKINETEVTASEFAYDGCHRIYLIEDQASHDQALQHRYELYPIDELPKIYDEACPLRFIYDWNLEVVYVTQDEQAVFSNNEECDHCGGGLGDKWHTNRRTSACNDCYEVVGL